MRLPERNSSEGRVPGRSLQGPHRKHTCTDVHSPCHARQNQMGHRLARDTLRPCRTLPPNAGSTRHGIQDHVWCQTKVDALTVDGCFWPLVPFWWPRHCQEDGRPAPPRPPCAGHTQRTTYNTHLPPLGPTCAWPTQLSARGGGDGPSGCLRFPVLQAWRTCRPPAHLHTCPLGMAASFWP